MLLISADAKGGPRSWVCAHYTLRPQPPCKISKTYDNSIWEKSNGQQIPGISDQSGLVTFCFHFQYLTT
jgi:hypothetical protein